MEWIKYFSAFGGATLCSLFVTFIFNFVVNGTKKKRAQKEELFKKQREEELNKVLEALDEKLHNRIGEVSVKVEGVTDAVNKEINLLKEDSSKTKAGLQALLRSELIAMFNKWSDKGYAPIYARENFENCYQRYHELGANGVIDDIYHKFYGLPTDESVKVKNNRK